MAEVQGARNSEQKTKSKKEPTQEKRRTTSKEVFDYMKRASKEVSIFMHKQGGRIHEVMGHLALGKRAEVS